MQCRAAVKGHSLQTEAAVYFAEFLSRKRMAKLGYTTDFRDLTAEKADILATISIELEKAQADDQLARSKQRGRR